MWQAYLFEAHANYVKYIYSNAPCHTVHVRHIYWLSSFICAHELIWMWHLKGIFVSGTFVAIMCGVVITDCGFLGFVCTLMCGLHTNYSSAVGHMCDVGGTFVQGHISIMWNVCISVFLVRLLIAVSSYKAYVLTSLSHMCTWTYWHIWLICCIW